MLNLILAAALMADAPAAAPGLPAASTAPAAATPPDLRIALTDLSGCTALVNTMAELSPEGTDQDSAMQALSVNWSLVFDAAQGQSQQALRPAYDKALADYKTQIANAAGDETVGGIILQRLNEGLARCEGIRLRNADFFSFVVNDYLADARAKQAAAAPAAVTP